MALYLYKSYGKTINPKKLIIFIHGYKSSMEGIAAESEILSMFLPNTVIVTPQSDIKNKNNQSWQWYNIGDDDKQHRRHNPQASVEEIIEIYNRSGKQISQQAKAINIFIDEMQKLYKVDDSKTYIIGFSQGAMMAVYTALSRKATIGGCFALSGVIAGKDCLEEEINNKTPIFMLHGTDDNIVQYKTLDYSISWLEKHNIKVEAVRYNGLKHNIYVDELDFIAEKILQM